MTRRVNSCCVIDCFVNSLCKVCWWCWCCRAVNPQAEKKELLSHPPTPPPALLPPFAADLPCQPSPSLHSFSCSLPGRLFLHRLLSPVLLLCLSSRTATHYCFYLHLLRSLRCFLVTVWVVSYYYKAALCITN